MLFNSKNSKNLFKIVEIVIILSVLLSGFILFWIEKKNHDPDYKKSWVAFYLNDPDSIEKGVKLENHLGYETEFRFCLIPDSPDLIEPKDLSCKLTTVIFTESKNIPAGKTVQWTFKTPEEKGKYWIIAEYIDKDKVEKKRSLGVTI